MTKYIVELINEKGEIFYTCHRHFESENTAREHAKKMMEEFKELIFSYQIIKLNFTKPSTKK